MNKKGFTLVELLAVMVVLIIVILIAITRVRKTVDKSADEAIKANAGVVIKAVNAAASNVNIMQHSDLKDGVIGANNLSNYDISISGTKPDDGYFVMEEYEVKLACLIYDGYKIEYNNGNFMIVQLILNQYFLLTLVIMIHLQLNMMEYIRWNFGELLVQIILLVEWVPILLEI